MNQVLRKFGQIKCRNLYDSTSLQECTKNVHEPFEIESYAHYTYFFIIVVSFITNLSQVASLSTLSYIE